MSITSAERHQLHSRLSDVLGEDEANQLMEHLPPVGWADVATKRDLDHVESVLRAEITVLGTDLRAEMATLGARMDLLGARMDVESANLRVDIESLASTMLREQRIQLTVIIAVFSALAAMLTIFG